MAWNKWINVNDRLPTSSDVKVLVCLLGKFIKISYFFIDSYGEWFSSDTNIWDQAYTGIVTHWMPLPKILPREEKDVA